MWWCIWNNNWSDSWNVNRRSMGHWRWLESVFELSSLVVNTVNFCCFLLFFVVLFWRSKMIRVAIYVDLLELFVFVFGLALNWILWRVCRQNMTLILFLRSKPNTIHEEIKTIKKATYLNESIDCVNWMSQFCGCEWIIMKISQYTIIFKDFESINRQFQINGCESLIWKYSNETFEIRRYESFIVNIHWIFNETFLYVVLPLE